MLSISDSSPYFINLIKNNNQYQLLSVSITKLQAIDFLSYVIDDTTICVGYKGHYVIWDPVLNKEINSFNSKKQIILLKKINKKIIAVDVNGGVLFPLENKYLIENGAAVWFVQEGIVSYPILLNFINDPVKSYYSEKSNNRLKRSFQRKNKIKIGVPVFGEGDVQFSPPYYDYLYETSFLNLSKNLGITCFQLQNIMIFAYNDRFYSIKNKNYIPISTDFGFLLVNGQQDIAIYLYNDSLVVKPLISYMQNKIEYINNLPVFIYVNKSSKSWWSQKYGIIWNYSFADVYTYYNLYKREAYSLSAKYYGKTIIYADKLQNIIMEWRRGKKYPIGELILRLLDTSEDIVLYSLDHEISPQVNGLPALIIPDWHFLSLYMYYRGRQGTIQLSLSQYSFILEYWSRDKSDTLKFYTVHEPIDYINFGDLNEYLIIGIAPMWLKNKNLIFTYSYDKNVYIWDITIQTPVISASSGLPLTVVMDDKLIGWVSFSIDLIKLFAAGGKDYIETKYPIIELHIIFNNKHYSRKVPFPTRIISNKNISISINNHSVLFVFPSYIDNTQELHFQFTFSDLKFHKISKGSKNRFWQKHQGNRIKGKEIIVETHPEIYREYTLRHFLIFESGLIRKNDRSIIIQNISEPQLVPQISNHKFFDYRDRFVFNLPYYNNKPKPIVLSKDMSRKYSDLLHTLDLVELEPVKVYPHILYIPQKTTDIHLKTLISTYIQLILSKGEIHDQNGISFRNDERVISDMKLLLNHFKPK